MNDLNFCDNILLLKTLNILYNIINVVRIVVPILLIVKLTLDIYHAMLSGDNKQIKELSIKRIIAALMVFLTPTMVNLVLSIISSGGGGVNTPYCLSNLSHIKEGIKYYEKVSNIKKEISDVKKQEQDNKDYLDAKYNQARILQEEAKKKLLEDDAAIHVGQRYNLSENELIGLCGVARAEQGNIEGAKAEASLMANLYELKGRRFNSLYDYVGNSGWFSNARRHMQEGCPAAYLEAVREVLVGGNRTLPLYIDEHDCFNCNNGSSRCRNGNKGDICSLTTDGQIHTDMSYITNRNNYVKDNTKVNTIYQSSGEYWVFYSFPGRSRDNRIIGDPFGYTPSARARIEAMGG